MGVTGSNQFPPLVEKEVPFQNKQKSGRNKNIWSTVPTVPETKSDYTGEYQQ
jgi:hypothetical protein